MAVFTPKFQTDNIIKFNHPSEGKIKVYVDNVSEYYHGGFFYNCTDFKDPKKRYMLFEQHTTDPTLLFAPRAIVHTNEAAPRVYREQSALVLTH